MHTWTLSIVICLALVVLVQTIKEPFTSSDEKKCLKNAKKSKWDDYDWQTRFMNNGEWKCRQGWEDTGCDWGMGDTVEKKQCRRKKEKRTDEEASGSACTSNSSCGSKRVCVGGFCNDKWNANTKTGYCTKTSHCGQGFECKDNVCVDQSPEYVFKWSDYETETAGPAPAYAAPPPRRDQQVSSMIR